MAFDLPLLTDQGDVAIATKIADSLKRLRDGSAITYGGAGNLNLVGGTTNAMTITSDPAGTVHTALVDGHKVNILPFQTSTGALTLALDGLAAIPVNKREGNAYVPLTTLETVTNIPFSVTYSKQLNVWMMQDNPKAIVSNLSTTFIADQIIEKAIPVLLQRSTSTDIGIRFTEQGSSNLGRCNISSNASWDGTNWNRDKTGDESWVLAFGGTGASTDFGVFYAAPAGNPITFVKLFGIDNAANSSALNTFQFLHNSGATTSNVTFPTVAIGDIIQINAIGSMAPTANNFAKIIVTNTTGTGLYKPRPITSLTMSTGVSQQLSCSGTFEVTGVGSLTFVNTPSVGAGTIASSEISAQRFFV